MLVRGNEGSGVVDGVCELWVREWWEEERTRKGRRRVIVFPLRMKALGVRELLRVDGESHKKRTVK